MTDVNVWRCRKPWHPQPCWHARCRSCGEATAFDYSAKDAKSLVEGACKCKAEGGKGA